MSALTSLHPGHDVRYLTSGHTQGGNAGATSYYTASGEPPGQWAGKGSAALGLGPGRARLRRRQPGRQARYGQPFPQQDKPCLRHDPVSLPVTSRPRDHPIACVQKVLLELGGYEPPQSLFSQFRSTFLFRSTAQEPSSHEKTGHRTLDR